MLTCGSPRYCGTFESAPQSLKQDWLVGGRGVEVVVEGARHRLRTPPPASTFPIKVMRTGRQIFPLHS